MSDRPDRTEVKTEYLRVTVSAARCGEGYRLALGRQKAPVPHSETGAWVPTRQRGLPLDGVTKAQVVSRIQALHQSAKKHYEAEQEDGDRMDERHEKRRAEREGWRDEQRATWRVETEEHRGGTVNRLEQP